MSAMTPLITIAIVIAALGVLSWILFVIVFIVQNRAFKKEMREAEKKWRLTGKSLNKEWKRWTLRLKSGSDKEGAKRNIVQSRSGRCVKVG